MPTGTLAYCSIHHPLPCETFPTSRPRCLRCVSLCAAQCGLCATRCGVPNIFLPLLSSCFQVKPTHSLFPTADKQSGAQHDAWSFCIRAPPCAPSVRLCMHAACQALVPKVLSHLLCSSPEFNMHHLDRFCDLYSVHHFGWTRVSWAEACSSAPHHNLGCLGMRVAWSGAPCMCMRVHACACVCMRVCMRVHACEQVCACVDVDGMQRCWAQRVALPAHLSCVLSVALDTPLTMVPA